MMNWIYWAVGYREPKTSITPNSMAKVPQDKFINYAMLSRKDLTKHKSIKQRKQMETYYDKYNH